MAVVAEADPRQAGRGELALHPRQVVGQGHLEVRWFAGNRMDRDGTGLQQGGLVGEGGRQIRREPLPGVEQQAPAGTLGRLRGGEAGALDGLDDAIAVHALERLRDREHREGRPVGDHGVDHRLDEHRRDQRPGPVVDQHRAIARRPDRSGRGGGRPPRPRPGVSRRRRRPRSPPAASRLRRPPPRAPARRPPPPARPGSRPRSPPPTTRGAGARPRPRSACRSRPCAATTRPRRPPRRRRRASRPSDSVMCPSRPRAIVSRDAAGRRSSARRRSGARGSR